MRRRGQGREWTVSGNPGQRIGMNASSDRPKESIAIEGDGRYYLWNAVRAQSPPFVVPDMPVEIDFLSTMMARDSQNRPILRIQGKMGRWLYRSSSLWGPPPTSAGVLSSASVPS